MLEALLAIIYVCNNHSIIVFLLAYVMSHMSMTYKENFPLFKLQHIHVGSNDKRTIILDSRNALGGQESIL